MKKTIVVASSQGAMSEKVIKAYKVVENGAVNTYKKLEKGVVEAYKHVKDCVVNGYQKIEDVFVNRFLDRDPSSRSTSVKRNNIK